MTSTAEPEKRKRASKPRSKQGCVNCRRRRVKCDEARPKCQRCIIRGIDCPGYESATPGTDNAVVTLPPKQVLQDAWESVRVTSYSLPYPVPGGKSARKALHYFCNDAAPCESATHYFTSDFWHRFVMQHCQHDAATRLAVVALSSIHLEHTYAEPSQLRRGYLAKVSPGSLEAYNKAVRTLRRHIEQQSIPSPRTVLTCCAVFFCLELIRGDHEAARLHFRNGNEILSNWRREKYQIAVGSDGQSCKPSGQRHIDPHDDFTHLIEIFGRLDLEFGIHDDNHVMQTSWPFLDEWGGSLTEDQVVNMPPPMRGLLRLVNTSYQYASRYHDYNGLDESQVPPGICQNYENLENQFEAWALGREGSEEADIGRFPETVDCARRSKPFPKWAFIGLFHRSLTQERGKTGQRTFRANSYRVLRMSEAIVEMDRRRKLPLATAAGYSPDVGVIAPLSLLAYRTSIAQIEAAAPDLLPAVASVSKPKGPEPFIEESTSTELLDSMFTTPKRARQDPDWKHHEDSVVNSYDTVSVAGQG